MCVGGGKNLLKIPEIYPEHWIYFTGENLMENDKRLELLCWVIDRNDRTRISYQTKAAILISANAIIAASTVFLLEKTSEIGYEGINLMVRGFSLLAIAFMAISIILSILATINLRPMSHRFTKSKTPDRVYFYNGPAVTPPKDLDEFTSRFQNATTEQFIVGACSELWVTLNLLRIRYNRLRKSIWLFIFSVILLASNLCAIILSSA